MTLGGVVGVWGWTLKRPSSEGIQLGLSPLIEENLVYI